MNYRRLVGQTVARPLIVDTEVHLVQGHAPMQRSKDYDMVEHWTWHEHSGDLIIAEMNRAGVDKAFLVGHGDQSTKLYDKIFLAKYPDRFYWFPQIPNPRNNDNLDIIEKDLSEGAYGVKVFPYIMNLNLNDPDLIKVWELMRRYKKKTILCFGDPPLAKAPLAKRYIDQLNDEILPKFKDVKFQLNHGGCIDPLSPEAEAIFHATNNHPNLFISTSFLGFTSSNQGLTDDEHEYPFPNHLKRLRRLYERIGADRLMFATDWPWPEKFRKYIQDVDAIRKHANFMSEEDKLKFLGQNALRFLEE